MANALYPEAKETLINPTTLGTTSATALDLNDDDIKVILVRGYTYSATHEDIDDVTGGGGGTIVATSSNLGSKTVANGTFDAGDVTFSAVSAGAACESLIVYKDTGTTSTSRLIAYIDTATGLPVTPNGGDITVAWNGSGIFAL